MTTPAPGPLSAAGAALLRAGRPDEAVDVLRRAHAAGEPGAADLLAQAYLDARDWPALVEWLVPLVERGEFRFAWRVGVALAALGDTARAESAFRFAVEHGELGAANDLAILLRDGGRAAEAAQVLRRAADAGDPQAAANLVELYYEAGDLVRAVEIAERSVSEARPDTLVALADVRAAVGRHDEAEACYRRAAALGAVRAHSAYAGFLLAVRADPAGAERELREAGRRGEPGWAYALGRFLVDDARPDEGRGYLELAAADGDPDAADLLDELDELGPYDEL